MPLQDLKKDKFLLSSPSSLYLHPPPTLHSLKHGLLEDRIWMPKVMLVSKVYWSTFTTIIKQTRGRLIDSKEEILAEDVAQWWSTHIAYMRT